ncbi:MAG: VWA domain-containing protein [Fimbriimonadaceae bacterium]|nr:VWA domain-containing protein [Fimbriimonadaceae bacterium]
MSASTTPSVRSDLVEPPLVPSAVGGIQQGAKIMPLYILLDTSGSMKDVEKELNDFARELQQLAKDEPQIADVAYMCVIGFDSTARVLIPLGDIREASMPVITAGGGTNYSAAFELLAARIQEDSRMIHDAGAAMFRPLAIWLSDGAPQDREYMETFRRLFDYDAETETGNRSYPRFVPIGMRNADAETLAKLAYPAKDGLAFLSRPGVSPADAIAAFLDFVGKTTLATGATATSPGGPRHEVAREIAGFDPIESQYAGGDWILPAS